MNALFEKIYYNCPVFIQNFAIGLLGYKLAKERFQQEGEEYLGLLDKIEGYSSEETKTYQEAQFVALAKHAINNTKFYQSWAKNNQIVADDIKSIADLQKFPIVEKQTIRENPDSFRALNIPNQFKLGTSGTTGTPLVVYTDKISRSKHYAFFTRLRANYGVKASSRRCTLFGRIIMKADSSKPPFWRYDWFQKNLLMSSYHLKESNLRDYYNKLLSFMPEEIFAYPSSITPIAEFIVRERLPRINLKLIMTTAENLSSYQRDIIGKAFDAPILNQYGCTEMVFFSYGDDGDLHVALEHGYLEVVDKTGEIKSTGVGEMVATGYINYSMPIIRYKVGDNISLKTNEDNGKQTITSVDGRVDDVLYRLDGTPVGRLDPVFKGRQGIKLAQIIQNEMGSVHVNIVSDASFNLEKENILMNEFTKRFGSGVHIKIIKCDDIAKAKNGKFKSVISLYKGARS